MNYLSLLLAPVMLIPGNAHAATFPVTVFTDLAPTAGNSEIGAGDGPGIANDLRFSILLANTTGGSNTITFVCGTPPCIITLGGPLPPLTSNLTIDGGTFGTVIIDGNSLYRVFFADTGAITLANLQIQNALAQGGAGADGKGPGGGGAGFGAGLFVNQASALVSLQSTYFLNCSAVGGAGGNGNNAMGSGGGGSMGGFRGASTAASVGAGGAGMTGTGLPGGGHNGGNGGPGGGGGGGAATAGNGGTGGGAYGTNDAGTTGAQTGGVPNSGSGGFGGGGGGGGDLTIESAGGFGGGGGGDRMISGSQPGNGGFGGGTGGAVGADSNGNATILSGIRGGYGGYGGGSYPNATPGGAGGGAAAGPAIFVNLGSVTILNGTGSSFSATAGLPGNGAHSGSAGTASSAAVFNFGGSVNNSTTKGPLASALPGGLPATHFTVVPASLLLGSGTASSVTITALDSTNATSFSYNGTVHFTSTDPGFVAPPDSLLTNGAAVLAFTMNQAGNQTISATDTLMASLTGISTSVAVSSGVPARLVFAVPARVASGTPFNFTVTAQDAYGNTSAAFSDAVHFTSTDGSAVLPANWTSLTGTATLSATLNTAGNQTVSAQDTFGPNAALHATSSTIFVVAMPPSPPTLATSFGAPTLALNATTTMSFTVTNPNLTTSLSGVAFTDSLPSGLVVSTPNGLSGSCGTVVAVAHSGSLNLSGLSLAASGTCTFSVNITGAAPGLQHNTTGAITSVEGGTGATASASVTVIQIGQTITFGPIAGHIYGDAPFTVIASSTSALPVAFTVTSGPCSVVGSTVAITGAGNCVLTASQAGNANYSAAPPVLPQTLTVSKAVLTVTAGNASMYTGLALPTLSAVFTGFVKSETSAVLTGSPSLSTTATSASPVGSYPITVALGTLAAVNYSFTLVNGTLTVQGFPASFSVSPTALNLQYVKTALSVPFTQSFSISSTPSGAYSATSSAKWLIAPAGTIATSTYRVTLDPTTLAPGTYTATLNFSSPGGSPQVPVTLTVTLQPTLVSASATVKLTAAFGATLATQDIQLTSTGSNVAFSAAGNVPWLTVSSSSTTTPATLHIQASPSGLGIATWQGLITVSAPAATNGVYSLPVSFVITGTGAPGQSAVDNAASFGAAAAAPNTIMTLFGPALSCTPDPQVLLNGTPAAVLFAGAAQINFVSPGAITGQTATIQVACNGTVIGTAAMPLLTVNPAIFTQTGTGNGPGSIVNQDGTINSAGKPASRKAYISVYGTGFGPFNAASADGLRRLTYPVTATIGGVVANVVYAGEAPTETSGLQQINIQVPAGAPAGPVVTIVLTTNKVSTQSGITVAIQ